MFRPMAEVMEKEFPPLKFLIPNILLEVGTSVLAGPPKIGKSYFLLNLIGQIAREDQKVFYFAGEDGDRRLQDRAKKLNLNPKNIIVYAGREHPVDRNMFFDLVKGYLEKKRDIKVAIFDTMTLSLPPKPKRQYDDWVIDLQPWNDLAHELEIQLLMVHHTRKGEVTDGAGDEAILGSTGINASFEDILMMQRVDGNVQLYVKGKNIPENTIALNKQEYGYTIGNEVNTSLNGLGKTSRAVLDCIMDNNDTAQFKMIKIMEDTGFRTEEGKPIQKPQMSEICKNLLNRGLICRGKNDGYYPAPKPE